MKTYILWSHYCIPVRERESLHLLDFGHFEMHAERGVEVIARSGKLWRLRLRGDADSPLSFVRRARQWQKGTVR
jgi:hypothetical protein